MLSRERNNGLLNGSPSRGMVYRYPYPNYAIDVAWLKKILPESRGQIYVSSGEANYKVYSEIEEELKIATDRNGAVIHFLTGPIISVPDEETQSMKQGERENLNPIVKMAREKKIILYPTSERLSKHYRVFEEMNVVSAFDVHDLCERSSNLWFYYGDELETKLRIEDFMQKIDKVKPFNGELTKYFVFLSEKEIQELKKWAKDEQIDTLNINLDECRQFLEKAIS